MIETEGLYDEALASTRAEFGIARAEIALLTATRAQAEQWAAIVDVLREARSNPEVFVGEAFADAPDAVEFSIRAACADLAVRLGVAEGTVRAMAHDAETLIARTPMVWAWFREGEFAVQNVRVAADLARDIPAELWRDFDAALVGIRTLAPARFRLKARAIAVRMDAATMTERHRKAAEERRVWVEHDRDGMALFVAHLSAEAAQAAWENVDRIARHLVSAPDETRTLAQIRADVATDLLAGKIGAKGVGVTIAVTVPVMTLLGGDEPATLAGYGPIDAETARRLAAHAPSFTRILTHPITGMILDIDPNQFRVPKHLARIVKLLRPTCMFTGCGRLAAHCDLDHTQARADGGTNSVTNLGPMCRNHHRIKHKTAWTVINNGVGFTWTSPTGHISDSDPPPF